MRIIYVTADFASQGLLSVGKVERKSLRKAKNARKARLSAEAEHAENRVRLDAVLAQYGVVHSSPAVAHVQPAESGAVETD